MAQGSDQIPFEKPRVLLEWEAPTRIFESKSRGWFVSLSILSVATIVILALLQQFLLALVIGAFVFMLYAWYKVEPQKIKHAILNSGVRLDSKLYEWRYLRSFCIQKKGAAMVLSLITFLNLPHQLEIILPEDKVDQVEEVLLKYLPYRECHQVDYLAWVDRVVSLCGKALRFVSP